MPDFKSNTKEVDVLIIGAGPSATVAASILHKKGYTVHIVEKQKFPRFVIGESLLPRCMENFQKANLIETIESHGFQKKFGAMFAKADEYCDFEFANQFTEGWGWTWQVQRADFDKVLAEEVQNRGVTLEYETEVTDVKFENDGSSTTTVKNKDSEYYIKARYIVDSSGYGKVLPRLLNLEKPSNLPPRTSIFCHVKPRQVSESPERKRIIIIVHLDNVWGWVIPFSDGTSSIGMVGDSEEMDNIKGSMEEQMRHWIANVQALRDRFTDSEFIFEPRKIAGYSSDVKQLHGKGYVLTGNASGFLDPIFSSGVTLATESSALAAELIEKELEGEPVDWDLSYTEHIKKGNAVFKAFIEAWYRGDLQKIFFSENRNEKIRKQICSVLAGYVWDQNNPFVTKPERILANLSQVIR
ncbi:NAD(P)/FAD-dependent oxidoreductase [Fulvivirga sediminis]|uniref:Tryptophan 7-halogenase n=1 Tax=Fulvivirga sediminis TaxID=2803949 RepID=A0A937K1M7_9BACT|nr:NAD(P)/FAD-dependent oxidoreductase [Fulvivirga sediminis]MBL3656847.1 tryptophan 7-halogenase [Fulvivirga sediminis]